jgi:flagellar biosynthesis/type III secretory pathway protein FliH
VRRQLWKQSAALVLATAVIVPAPAAAQLGRGQPHADSRGWENAAQNAYERGLREGLSQGTDDGRRGRTFSFDVNSVYRNADRGYQSRYGSREAYRDAFRRGFASGYRDGYERYRGAVGQNRRDDRPGDRRAPRGYQEPAYARGFSDGYQHGVSDGRDGDRYDPVRHGDYRDADEGYFGSYGSKDAYRNNSRAGFRPGYEQGYRDGRRRR